jgi:hypothetical protein
VPYILADRKVFFEDGTVFEGLTFLENGGVWCIEKSKEGGVSDRWRWYPPTRINMIYREQPK